MVAELFPRAWEALAQARRARSAGSAAWNDLLGTTFREHLVTYDDGVGRITISGSVPEEVQREITRHFGDFIIALWVCLDALVAETAHHFSNRNALNAPEQERYFPMSMASFWSPLVAK